MSPTSILRFEVNNFGNGHFSVSLLSPVYEEVTVTQSIQMSRLATHVCPSSPPTLPFPSSSILLFLIFGYPSPRPNVTQLLETDVSAKRKDDNNPQVSCAGLV